jgi:hypothetical protein
MFDLPIRRYDGAVYLVSSPQDRERALADIRTESVVGFDTETRPAFRKGESYLPCLAQVATARAVYLFQLQQQDFSAEMRELLASERVAKAGVALANDLRGLKKLIEFDARRAGRDRGIEIKIFADFFGFRHLDLAERDGDAKAGGAVRHAH